MFRIGVLATGVYSLLLLLVLETGKVGDGIALHANRRIVCHDHGVHSILTQRAKYGGDVMSHELIELRGWSIYEGKGGDISESVREEYTLGFAAR